MLPAKPRFKALAATAVAFVIAALTATPALAGEYELVKGKGVEVCEAYLKNLNSFEPDEPMRCERPVNLKFKDFQKPKWERIDGLENFPLVESAYEFLERPTGSSRKAELDGLRQNIAAKNEPYTFSTARLDIDNDGKQELVLRFFDTCIPFGTKGRYGTPILAVAGDGQQVDEDKSKRFMGDNVPLNWEYLMYDVFLYKGATYSDYWVDYVGKQVLRVSRTDSRGTTEICRYKFTSR